MHTRPFTARPEPPGAHCKHHWCLLTLVVISQPLQKSKMQTQVCLGNSSLKMHTETILLSAWEEPHRRCPALDLSFLLRTLHLWSLLKSAQLCFSHKPSLFKAQLWHHLQEVSPPFCSSALRITLSLVLKWAAKLCWLHWPHLPSFLRIQKMAQLLLVPGPTHLPTSLSFRPWYFLSSLSLQD